MRRKNKIILGLITVWIAFSFVYTASALERRVEIKFARPVYTTHTIEEIKRLCELKDLECDFEEGGTIREITAYNAGDPTQTDSSPCISANGENICLALEKGYKRCAANFVPFGTILRIQNYGDCLVVDRLNSKFRNRVDIAMAVGEKKKAIAFGKQNLRVEVIK